MAEQVGGDHYGQKGKPQHWDLVITYNWDYFQSQVTKYLMRWKFKHKAPAMKLEDLKKARSFLDKYIENYEKFLPESQGDVPMVGIPLNVPLTPQSVKMISGEPGPDPTRLYMYSDVEFNCEGFRGDGKALFQDRNSKKEYWALSLEQAYQMRRVEQNLPGVEMREGPDYSKAG